MAFELGRITEGDLPYIFPNVHDDKLENRALYNTTRDYFYGIYQDANKRKEIVGKRWIVDKERRAFMTCATVTYLHNVGSSTYFFGWEGGTAIFSNRGYCRYAFYSVTDDLLPRIEQLKPMIAEALSIAGEYYMGEESKFYNRVPHAEFLPYPSKGA